EPGTWVTNRMGFGPGAPVPPSVTWEMAWVDARSLSDGVSWSAAQLPANRGAASAHERRMSFIRSSFWTGSADEAGRRGEHPRRAAPRRKKTGRVARARDARSDTGAAMLSLDLVDPLRRRLWRLEGEGPAPP